MPGVELVAGKSKTHHNKKFCQSIYFRTPMGYTIKKMMVDVDCLVDCPEEGCDGFMMRIGTSSEFPVKWMCVICGLVTWKSEEMQTHTGVPMHELTVPIFQNWNV